MIGVVLGSPGYEAFRSIAYAVDVGVLDVADRLPLNAREIGVDEVGIGKVCAFEIDIGQIGLAEVSRTEVGVLQVGGVEVTVT